MRGLWNTWVALWDHHEHPRSMALIRVLLGCVVLWDLFWIAGLDLVVPLLAPEEAGGLSKAMTRPRTPPWHAWLPPTAGTGWALWIGLFGSALAWTCGLFTRTSMLIFVLLSAQFNWILPNADRGIDTLIRNVVLILACSQCGSWASIDAKIRIDATGRWALAAPGGRLLRQMGLIRDLALVEPLPSGFIEVRGICCFGIRCLVR